jgi:hypothetical protein
MPFLWNGHDERGNIIDDANAATTSGCSTCSHVPLASVGAARPKQAHL